ncbi:MAG: DUF2325 domain-containing protein [Thermodesulfobacteriota bacterium]
MCVTLVGGMARLERPYRDEAELLGVELRVFNEGANRLGPAVRGADAVVVFTGKVSHEARRAAVRAAQARGIPVLFRHSCGVCSLRDCLACLTRARAGGRHRAP